MYISDATSVGVPLLTRVSPEFVQNCSGILDLKSASLAEDVESEKGPRNADILMVTFGLKNKAVLCIWIILKGFS